MKIENWIKTERRDRTTWKHVTGISILLKNEGPVYILVLYDKAGREQYRLSGTNKTDLEEKCASWQRGFNKHLQNKQEPENYISVAGGKAHYIKTEVEDSRGKWDDNYFTKDGYYVLHKGKKHHVYKLKEEIKEKRDDNGEVF
jgi:hypothetical protein